MKMNICDKLFAIDAEIIKLMVAPINKHSHLCHRPPDDQAVKRPLKIV